MVYAIIIPMKLWKCSVFCLALSASLPASAGWRYRTPPQPKPAPQPAPRQPTAAEQAAYAKYLESMARMNSEAMAQNAADARAVQAAYARRKEDPAVVDARVVKFLQERIDNGSVDARYDMARRRLEGQGVEKDRDVAVRLLGEAAAQGHEPSKRLLKELGSSPEPGGASGRPAEAAK